MPNANFENEPGRNNYKVDRDPQNLPDLSSVKTDQDSEKRPLAEKEVEAILQQTQTSQQKVVPLKPEITDEDAREKYRI